MNEFVADLVAAGAGVANRVKVGIAQLRRTTPGPALTRLTASLSAATAFAVALPDPSMFFGPLSLLLPAAVCVGLFPRTRWVSIALLLVVGEWVLTTVVFEITPPLWRVGLLAATIYLAHSAAALAAVLPHDCVVAPSVVVRAVARTGGVLAVSLAAALGALAVAGRLPAERTVIGPIVGSCLAAGLVGVLAWQLRRSGRSARPE